MADTAAPRKRLTVREFLEWEERQPHKYELHGGLIRMMAGGTRRHSRIKGNIFAALHRKLQGKQCEPFDSDLKVQTAGGGVYYPDVMVDCGDAEDDETRSETPTVVFEVLSGSTRKSDLEDKLPDYKATPSIKQIVYVDSELMHVMVWSHTEDGWVEDELVHPEQMLRLDSIRSELSFGEIYAGANFAV